MWLPETAVDDETLDVVAGEGIRFTILAPHQVERAPAGGLPGWYRPSGGRRIALFIYDGAISHDVAFGPLVRDADAWVERLTAGANQLVAVATDGETFGHHHKGGAVVLARVLEVLKRRDDVRVENFASFLARQEPEEEVRLIAPSSWSCPHGVERWRAECGCRAAPERGLHQRWRAPLRAALDWLSGELHAVFERSGRPLPPELERHALRMFTSCGWFFDDIAGIESVIVLRSAARAIELSGSPSEAARLEAGLLGRPPPAPGNDPAGGGGRGVGVRGATGGRSGVAAGVLWLTGGVGEPVGAAPVAAAGVRCVVLDDRHFLVSGFEREQLHAPFWTESGGKQVALFPIDERLRYLIPFRPPAEISAYPPDLRSASLPLPGFGSDGAKFGGWPGPKGWGYTRGWMPH